MPNQALMMLDAFDKVHPLDEATKEFAKRLLNTAYQEGKLDGLNFLTNTADSYEQDNTLHN